MNDKILSRILYAEDEPDIQVIARMALETIGGFQVHVCSSGHEAIAAASSYAPDLILLDVMMPGLDGPSTLAKLRELPELRDTPIVFMTAKVQESEKARYRQLGAVDVISKPFDPMTLADTVRSIWNARPVAQAPAQSAADIVEKLRVVREGYARQLPVKLAQVEQAFRKREDRAELQNLRYLVHGLAGSGATFGYPEVSAVGRKIEAILDAAISDDRLLDADEGTTAADLIAALEKAACAPVAWSPSPSMRTLAVSGYAKKLIYLVDDDTDLATDLALQLGHFGYEVRIFATPEQLSDAEASPSLAVVLMDIVFPEGDLAGPEAVIELNEAKRLNVPVVFLSVREDLPARLAAARAGAAAYIIKPVDVGMLLETLDDLTSGRLHEPYRVLIVDDSKELAEHYAYTLQTVGVHTEVITDPMAILSHMANFRPDLVLMDMYMPGCTGAELAAVIRQLESYVFVPIVFLSAETDASKQLQAMRLGGDDFLTKPIEPEHLIAAVTSRLRRYRALRFYIERDSLTGLLNHAATKGRLAVEVARTVRQPTKFSFVMIDLDHFKEVNDTYGHLVGDRVLKSLAELLKRRLRSTDIIGRVGGEEFAIILTDTTGPDAVALLDELRIAFSQVRHYADNQREFKITFSCGVTEYHTGDTPEVTHAKADQILYRAKQGGRNRVEQG